MESFKTTETLQVYHDLVHCPISRETDRHSTLNTHLHAKYNIGVSMKGPERIRLIQPDLNLKTLRDSQYSKALQDWIVSRPWSFQLQMAMAGL